ncbi:MAG: hypothetical protein J6P02_01005 [Lachnospiraceae bacterium]|nr:hypothetical protein [Lachnospiraceae bacterium]
MCTSIVINRKKTVVGFNLDILNMEHRVRPTDEGVYIEINDTKEGWMPLFGANNRGDFVAMPTCWPFDSRSNPVSETCRNIIMLDIDLLLKKKTFAELKEIVKNEMIYSIPGVTFMSALSNKNGDVLHIVPGQGSEYYEKPEYKIMTNFSPYKQDKEKHDWMGWDRYNKAEEMIKNANDDFSVKDCFEILKTVSQTVCPTVVSMVFDVSDNVVYWCEDRKWEEIKKKSL